VYRSDDGGSTWSSIADSLPSDFGFAIVAHPARAATAWVAPLVADGERIPPDGALKVWRTDDNGASWASVSAGLPESGFYASVLRDAFTVDDVGASAGLYLGTRDGSVYASADEGGGWAEVASHLPDVLCVRAATIP
ncbi:MAG: WD40/YVTN/BNR-like repeat-containing protein, partial [Acidimicrobiales bacterium]